MVRHDTLVQFTVEGVVTIHATLSKMLQKSTSIYKDGGHDISFHFLFFNLNNDAYDSVIFATGAILATHQSM